MTSPTGTGPARRTMVRGWRILRFALFFGGEFLLANLQVLQEILRPHPRSAPAIVAVPIRCRTQAETVWLANLVTLTPGTLTVEIALEPPILYVHGMFAGDPETLVANLRRMEDRLLAALRPVGAAPDERPERR